MLSEYFPALIARVFDQVAHAMSLVRFLCSTCVVAHVAWKNGLHLMCFDVMASHFARSTFDR